MSTHGDEAVQPGDPLQTAAYLSKLYLAASNRALAAGSPEVVLDDSDRPYADDDYLGIASRVTTYLDYWGKSGGVMKYNSWETEGNGNIDYGVIGWPLPNDAIVAIIGDWARVSAMPRATRSCTTATRSASSTVPGPTSTWPRSTTPATAERI